MAALTTSPTTMAAPATPIRQVCNTHGACQGRTIPCLTCTHPDAKPWPGDEKDTCTLMEWATGPLLLAVPVGLVGGFVYGVLRHFFPAFFG